MKQESVRTQALPKWLGAAALGALAMYFSDPDRGKRRRALARDKMHSLQAKTRDALDVTMRDFSNRWEGLQAQFNHLLFRRNNRRDDDQIVVARVRAKLGRVVSHPHAIEVTAHRGHVVLRGLLLTHEHEKLIDIVYGTPGVIEVKDHLELHERPDGISSLQGGSERSQVRPEFMQENWTPALRAIAIVGGGALSGYGFSRRTPAGTALVVAGLALLTRGLTNKSVRQFVGISAEERTIELVKTIDIKAPPDTVFDVWTKYENFPQFMSHVLEVRDLGQQSSHWVVKGPAGVRIEWNAVLTENTRPSVLAWKTEPGSTIEHAGSIHFEPANGGTRVTVRMSYHLPPGAMGQGLALLLGDQPKRELGDDLIRMKAFIESGIPPHDAAKLAVAAPGQMLH